MPPNYFSNSKNYSRFGGYNHVDGLDLSKRTESNSNSSNNMGPKYSNASIDAKNFGIGNSYEGNSTILNNVSEKRFPISTVKTEFNEIISPAAENCNGIPEVNSHKVLILIELDKLRPYIY